MSADRHPARAPFGDGAMQATLLTQLGAAYAEALVALYPATGTAPA